MEKPFHKYFIPSIQQQLSKEDSRNKKNKDSAQKFQIKQRIINDTANHRVYYVVLADNKLVSSSDFVHYQADREIKNNKSSTYKTTSVVSCQLYPIHIVHTSIAVSWA